MSLGAGVSPTGTARLPGGLSAFPLTPFDGDRVDEAAFAGLVQRLVAAGVDSITVLGSTGSYPYLDRAERARVAQLAVQHADEVPVLVGVGALRTSWVHQHVDDAQQAGAAGVLLAPVSYQALTDEDVYGLYRDVTDELAVPLVVYDNPGTTHVRFTDDLYGEIARLPHVSSIKIPGVPAEPAAAAERIAQLRTVLPEGVTIGVSGDVFGATGLSAGCAVWYSVLGGTVPEPVLAITRAALSGAAAEAEDRSQRVRPLWDLFALHGSLRVTAAIAEELGLVPRSCLPLPLRGLDARDRARVATVLHRLEVG